MGGSAGIADIVGHVLGSVGDHRQLAAQFVHVVERACRNFGDKVNALAILRNQAVQLPGAAGQPVDCDSPQRFEVAPLRGDEIARDGQFGVDADQPLFQKRRFPGEPE